MAALEFYNGAYGLTEAKFMLFCTFQTLRKNKKNSKLIKTKIKKIKKRTQKRDSNLYDINNFVVQNNSNKINEKKDYINIPIPVFRELEEDFYNFKEEMKDLGLNSNKILINKISFVFFLNLPFCI